MNPFSSQNPLESLMQIGKMGEQMRKMFGDEFLSKYMSNGWPGMLHPQSPFNPNKDAAAGNDAGQAEGWDWNQLAAGNYWPNFSQFGSGHVQFPKMDLYHTQDDLKVVAELPGLMKPHEVSVIVEPRRLMISGQTTSHYQAVQHGQFAMSERHHGRFERSIELPAPVKIRAATAKYRNGLLEVTLPKAQGSARLTGSREIPIEM